MPFLLAYFEAMRALTQKKAASGQKETPISFTSVYSCHIMVWKGLQAHSIAGVVCTFLPN